jgi:ubiquinone/menaquinone biosynthesis C-methylase UbiE
MFQAPRSPNGFHGEVNTAALEVLRCPACGQSFALESSERHEIDSGRLTCACERAFAIEDGIPHLAHPPTLLPSDAEFQEKYDAGAEAYDSGLAWLFAAFRCDEAELRKGMVDLLELRPGSRVLETGCGTGKDSEHIRDQIQPGGTLYAQDLSLGMLRIARRKLTGGSGEVEFVLSNAAYLPFADETFDAAYHFGGINTFGELRRALSEMTRVVRVGGKVVVGDEGIAPWLRRRLFGRILVKANPLYAHRPPLAAIPDNAADVRLQWILGNAFYVIDYRVAAEPPFVDLDLPIPGKGDSLRSRYYASRR